MNGDSAGFEIAVVESIMRQAGCSRDRAHAAMMQFIHVGDLITYAIGVNVIEQAVRHLANNPL